MPLAAWRWWLQAIREGNGWSKARNVVVNMRENGVLWGLILSWSHYVDRSSQNLGSVWWDKQGLPSSRGWSLEFGGYHQTSSTRETFQRCLCSWDSPCSQIPFPLPHHEVTHPKALGISKGTCPACLYHYVNHVIWHAALNYDEQWVLGDTRSRAIRAVI